MNRLVLLTAVAMFMGCGSPVAPSPGPAPAPAALGFSLTLYSVGQNAKGLGSPTSVTLTLLSADGTSSGVIEGAVFKVIGEDGGTLTEAAVLNRPPFPGGTGSASQAAITETLTWAVEKGYGRRLDVLVTVRDGAGNTRVVPLSRSFP